MDPGRANRQPAQNADCARDALPAVPAFTIVTISLRQLHIASIASERFPN
jgi:hypothetical protein